MPPSIVQDFMIMVATKTARAERLAERRERDRRDHHRHGRKSSGRALREAARFQEMELA
jgi:hypothetical protein